MNGGFLHNKNENYPTVIKKDYYRVEMSEYQFQIYQILRAKERLSEDKGGRCQFLIHKYSLNPTHCYLTCLENIKFLIL